MGERVAAHDEEIVGEHERAARDDQVRGRALRRPDERQRRLIEAGQAAVALVEERIGAEGHDDLPARDGQPAAARRARQAAVASQNCSVRTSTDSPHGSPAESRDRKRKWW